MVMKKMLLEKSGCSDLVRFIYVFQCLLKYTQTKFAVKNTSQCLTYRVYRVVLAAYVL